ncbi:ribbon-helix-helix protein, CopG family [Brevundimonas sp. LM2]|uniref:ribbon-helix-helix protein, CopG family n=1 Tax=Brevundimonas sp. LM2 TaxID=1938605 RepID=UPI00209B7868|nr:ribbon-helix-helix protein, CopG family [Brevundimonas sp. LM2]
MPGVTRNLTLAIDDDLLDKVRVLAAMKRTSVNEMVRGFLTRLVEQESEHDEATEALLKLARESKGRMGEWRFSREETYSGEPRFDREY